MKIAFIIYSLSNGGAEKVVSLLSKQMAKEHDVSIILFHNSIDYEYDGKIINLDLPSNQGKLNKFINIAKRTFALKKVFKQEKFDQVFSFMESANIPSILASKETVASIRNNPNKFDVITRNIIKLLYNRAKKVVVNSLKNKRLLEEEYRLRNVEVIYNPIDLKFIQESSMEPVSLEYKYIVAIGRLHIQKGFDLLIEAYSKSESKEKLKLVIIGEGSLKEELIFLSKKFNLEEHVIFLGRKSNPFKYIKNSEFFVLSSRYEGFPNVLIEALACQKPVIAFDCETGPSEIIQDKINGLLVENGNVDALSHAIDKLSFDDQLKNKFCENSFISVNKLNLDIIVDKWYNTI